MRTPTRRLLLALSLLGTLAATGRADTLEGFTEETVIAGLSAPTALAFLPDGRLVITELDGSLLLADLVAEGVIVPDTLAEIPVAFCEFALGDYETGLLGVAVDPAFAENGFLYLYRTFTELDPCTYENEQRFNQVVRVTFSDPAEGLPSVDLGSLTVLVGDIRAPLPYHCGGGLRIGPDDKLYASTGDTYVGDSPDDIGPGESTNPYAEDLTALEGKVLRLELDGSIPTDNPFYTGGEGGTREEIFAYGFRNPWRFGFDPVTGALWLGDVGQETIEELDLVVPGGNHAWPRCEGKLPGGCKQAGDVQPVFTYPHTGPKALGGGDGATIVGGAFAPGQFDYYGDIYFFADFVGGSVFSAKLNKPRSKLQGQPATFASDVGLPVDLVFGPDHALYLASIDGRVVRISPPPSGGQQALAGKSLTLKDGAKKSLKLLGKDLVTLGGGEDNPVFAGGTLRVLGTSLVEGNGVLFDDTYALPAKGWKLVGKAPDKVKGFKYADKTLENGPINSVLVKDGKLVKVTGKGDGLLHTLGTEPAVVQIVLTLGTRSWCLAFDEPTKFTADSIFTSKNQPAPVACP